MGLCNLDAYTTEYMAAKSRQGAIGALLDEYERSVFELKRTIAEISDQSLIRIIDLHATDANCRSIQTVLSHVVSSGYGYATSIHNLKGHGRPRPVKTLRSTVKEYLDDLHAMLEFTETVLSEFDDRDLEQLDDALKIKTGWDQLYDIEQLMEHAIVHILRHRRQLDKMKTRIEK
jgi:uncharacterized damage-inducible protein DinB